MMTFENCGIFYYSTEMSKKYLCPLRRGLHFLFILCVSVSLCACVIYIYIYIYI